MFGFNISDIVLTALALLLADLLLEVPRAFVANVGTAMCVDTANLGEQLPDQRGRASKQRQDRLRHQRPAGQGRVPRLRHPGDRG